MKQISERQELSKLPIASPHDVVTCTDAGVHTYILLIAGRLGGSMVQLVTSKPSDVGT